MTTTTQTMPNLEQVRLLVAEAISVNPEAMYLQIRIHRNSREFARRAAVTVREAMGFDEVLEEQSGDEYVAHWFRTGNGRVEFTAFYNES